MPDMDKLLNKGKLTDEDSVGKYLGACVAAARPAAGAAGARVLS